MKRGSLILGILLIICGLARGDGGLTKKDCKGCDRNKLAIPMTPLTVFYADSFCGGYVAKGVSLRSTRSGNITISGIPAGSTIRKAFLYWNALTSTLDSIGGNSGVFNGTPITGQITGSDDDPCWSVGYSQSFRKDVSSLVTGNGTYSLTSFNGGYYAEGATLVVFYENTTLSKKSFVLYDGNVLFASATGVESYNWTVQCIQASSPVVEAKITYIIADGQGPGLPDLMFYNDSLLDTNCTEGFDGPYWDTKTYDVTSLTPPGSNIAQCRYELIDGTAGQDCVTLLACVWEVSISSSCEGKIEEESRLNSMELSFNDGNLIFIIPDKGYTSLSLYDVVGRRAKILFDEEVNAGIYTTEINKRIPKGVYLAVLRHTGKNSKPETITKKIILW
ncbi:MAG: hypothetical protein PHE49_11875 [bacterium]|nr:hypothetical protein [bacterium]